MTPLRKLLKKAAAWQYISWPGLISFGAGMIATDYILHERLFLQGSEYQNIAVISFWSSLYVFALLQKRRRLGLDRDHEAKLRKLASSPGEKLTRWQAFQLRNYGWVFTLLYALGAVTAMATLMAGVFLLNHFWPGHSESMKIAAVTPLLIFVVIMVWRKQQRGDTTPKREEA